MHASAMRPESVEAALEQPFIKDPSKTIGVLLSEATQKFGERIVLSKIDIFSV
jgi:translation elongation factor EF-Ts